MPLYIKTTTFQQRLEITERAQAGQTDPQIAQATGWSVSTVRKWRRRFIKEGRAGLSSKIGRPTTGPLGTVGTALSQTILQLRKQHPGWGAETILVELKRDPRWVGQRLPSRARIAAALKQAGLTKRYRHHSELAQPKRQSLQTPHQEWQMDAQGEYEVAGVGKVSLITIADVVSRLKVESSPSLNSRNPALEDYHLALRRAFVEYGLPQIITLDHGAVFYDNTNPSPFPTRLHLWLIGLGVEVRFTRKRRPTDHALIERTHQTMTGQALLGQTYASSSALWAGLDTRREILNREFPTGVLNHQPPLKAYPSAAHSGRTYQPQWEVELLSMERVWNYLGQGRWFRGVRQNGCFQLGGYNYYLGTVHRNKTVEISLEVETKELVCKPEGSEEEVRLAVQGLSKPDLMGELTHFQALPTYQLRLPFGKEAVRQLEYARSWAA